MLEVYSYIEQITHRIRHEDWSYRNSRIVVGADNAAVIDTLRELYSPFMRREARFFAMDRKTAEIVKYASNCFLAAKISINNELANILETPQALPISMTNMRRSGMSMPCWSLPSGTNSAPPILEP